MAEEDELKTSFITPRGIYCYRRMPFELRNVGATFQRLMSRVLKEQIGKNIKVYIDDAVIKSKLSSAHLLDLKETFANLCKFGVKLNPRKMCF
jgi:hypothetical protein